MIASLTHLWRRVGAFIGGFEAGLANRRLKGFQPSRAHLNTLIAAAGPDITVRARWLVRNDGYAADAIESWAGKPLPGSPALIGGPRPCGGISSNRLASLNLCKPKMRSRTMCRPPASRASSDEALSNGAGVCSGRAT